MSTPRLPTGRIVLVDAEVQLTECVRRAQPMRSLLRLLSPYRRKLLIATGAFVIKDSPTWVLPAVVAAIIDIVASGAHAERIVLWAAIALALLALNYPFQMIVVTLNSAVTRSLAYTVRTGLAARLQRLSLGFHNRQSASVVQTKIVRDVENLELLLAQLYPTVISALTTLTGALVVTALNVPAFVPVYIVTIPVAASLVFFIRRRAVSRNEHFRHEVERLSAQVTEMATLLPVTRGHGLEDVATARVAERADSVRRAGEDLDVLNGRFGALSWIAYQVLGLACLVVAAVAAVTGILPITPGQVVLLSTYFGLLTSAIVMLMNTAPVLTRGLDALRSISEIAEELDVEDNAGKRPVNTVRGDITLTRATVRYGDTDPELGPVDLEIRAGETVAFVGPSGSGKSTLVNLVLGFVRPDDGSVRIDGEDLADLDTRSLRRFVSIVPQDTVLLSGTVRENVAYGTSELSDAQVRSALSDAQALDLVSGSEGLDTPIGERGSRLSGGQRQRLAIARALVRDPRILVLDEATSALDPRSEALISAALDRARRGRTTLIVAHRLSTVRGADRIVVLERGRIVESGSHAELLTRKGPYAEMIRTAEY